MLENTQFFNGVARTFFYTQAGKGGRNLNISAKKPVFLVSSGKNQNSPFLAHPRKTFGKIH